MIRSAKGTCRTALRFLLILFMTAVLSALLTQEARSEEGRSSGKYDPLIRSEKQEWINDSGKSYQYQLTYFLNANGEKEVQVSLIEAHWLAKSSQLTVLRGRDLNSDGVFDLWFYSEGWVVKSLQVETEAGNTWSTVKKIISDLSLNESRWISTLMAREMLASLSFFAEGEISDARLLEQMQIDLLDIDYRIKELESSKENPLLLLELRRISKQGWLKVIETVTHNNIEQRQKRILGDASLFVGMNLLLRGTTLAIQKGMSSSWINSLKGNLREFVTRQTGIASTIFDNKVKVLLPSISLAKNTNTVLFKSLHFQNEKDTLIWLSRNGLFTNTLNTIGGFLKNASVATWDNRAYIVTAQTIQLAVESYARGYWKFSEVPLVIDHPVTSTKDFLNNITNDKGLIQNLTYMTLQTSLLSGVSEALTRKGASLPLKYAICSVITMLDSTVVNVYVQGKTDTSRIAFDTSWELLVGGTQVHLDLHMLRWAAQLGEKYKNPRLKLVGYVLASIDQLTGYALYNQASSKFFEQDGAIHKPSQEKSSAPPVVIVPVLAQQ